MGATINSRVTGNEKLSSTGLYPGKDYKDLTASQQYEVEMAFDKLPKTEAVVSAREERGQTSGTESGNDQSPESSDDSKTEATKETEGGEENSDLPISDSGEEVKDGNGD